MVVFFTFLHFAGIIIALGAVTVIDTLGFVSRNSKVWTQVTIKAHHITKPLIWLGTFLMVFSWVFIYDLSRFYFLKSFLILILIINGLFLSFYISPYLDRLDGRNVLLPKILQTKITISMLISFFSWWILVYITILDLF